MRRLATFGLSIGTLALVGCWDPAWPRVTGDDGMNTERDGGVLTGDVTWFQDILPIVRNNCAACHGDTPRFAATMPMTRYQDVLAFESSGRPLHQVMAERVTSGRGQMPPPSQPQLSPEEIQAISVWSAQGAPMGTPVAEFTWHRDIEPVIREACHLCHGSPPQFSAPMSLVTYEDVTAQNASSVVYYEVMAFRIQAPSGRMPPPTHSRQLTPDEIAMITAWAESGAPEGEEPPLRDGGPGGRDAGVPDSGPGTPWRDGPGSPEIPDPDLRWFDIWAHAQGDPAQPFAAPQAETTYMCWSFLVETTEPVEYVTWMEPILDTTSNTHHLMAYVDDSGGDGRAEPVGPFACDGFPLEAAGGEFAEYIDGWFPGRGLTAFPEGIGIPVHNGDRIILQNHYDRVMGQLEDMSGIRLILDRTDHVSSGTLWTGVVWSTPLMGRDTREGECTITQPTTIYQGFPHMHTYGLSIRTDLARGGGAFVPIMEVPAWNFDDQPILPVPMQYQQLNAGDVLRTTCQWDTGNRSVPQGEGSLDEMCYNTFFSYPPLPNVGVSGSCVAFR